MQSIVKAYGKLIVGDDRSGIIGEFDDSTLDYYGDFIFRQSASQPFSQDGLPVFAGEFEATFEAGVGVTGGDDDPHVMRDISNNGGVTFGSKTTRALGKVGKYGQRTIWRRQGRFPVERVIRLTLVAKVKGNLIRLAATPELGIQ